MGIHFKVKLPWKYTCYWITAVARDLSLLVLTIQTDENISIRLVAILIPCCYGTPASGLISMDELIWNSVPQCCHGSAHRNILLQVCIAYQAHNAL